MTIDCAPKPKIACAGCEGKCLTTALRAEARAACDNGAHHGCQIAAQFDRVAAPREALKFAAKGCELGGVDSCVLQAALRRAELKGNVTPGNAEEARRRARALRAGVRA